MNTLWVDVERTVWNRAESAISITYAAGFGRSEGTGRVITSFKIIRMRVEKSSDP